MLARTPQLCRDVAKRVPRRGLGGWREKWQEQTRRAVRQVKQRRAPRGRAFKPVRLADSVIATRDATLELHQKKQEECGLPWRHIGSMIVMRQAQLLELPPAWELDMWKLWQQLDRDYRVRKFSPKLMGTEDVDVDEEAMEAWMYPYNLTKEQQLTEADLKGDHQSLDRRLTEPVYLLFKGKTGAWQFPQASHRDGESMRASAARALGTVVGNSIVTHPGGAYPLGYWWYAYGEKRREKLKPPAYGAKVFFMRSTYESGDLEIRIPDRIVDYGWFAKDELGDKLSEDLYAYIKHIL